MSGNARIIGLRQGVEYILRKQASAWRHKEIPRPKVVRLETHTGIYYVCKIANFVDVQREDTRIFRFEVIVRSDKELGSLSMKAVVEMDVGQKKPSGDIKVLPISRH